jgi:hypothetical protein
MKTKRIEWQRIAEPYLYGVAATVGDRRAEVVRAYAGEWFAYCSINGEICKPLNVGGYETRQKTMKLACAFLRGKITPEVWTGTRASVAKTVGRS